LNPVWAHRGEESEDREFAFILSIDTHDLAYAKQIQKKLEMPAWRGYEGSEDKPNPHAGGHFK